MLLGEVGKLREEKRALQYEIGCLLTMKSKYGPGGEFDPDWYVYSSHIVCAFSDCPNRRPEGATCAPAATGTAPAAPVAPHIVPQPTAGDDAAMPPRPAWRSVRTSRRSKRTVTTAAVPTAPPPPPAEALRPPVSSWATWQRELLR